MLEALRRTLRRLRLLSRIGERERAMDEEMRFHLRMEAAELERSGLTPEEARRRAALAFGGVERFKEVARDARGTRWIEDLWQDLRYAVRQLNASRGFAAATVLTLALGIGTTTMMYSVRQSALNGERKLPSSDRLVYLAQGQPGCAECVSMAPGNFLAVRAQAASLELVSMIADWEPVMRGPDGAELVDAARVSTDFFQTLAVRPVLGRTFVPDDSASDRNNVVVLSETAWRVRFGADSTVLGRTLVLDRDPYTVVGVAPDEAAFWPRGTGMWVPLELTPEEASERSRGRNRVFARLREGATHEGAAAEVAGIGGQLAAAYPEDMSETTLIVAPLLALERNRNRADPVALIFRASVGLVLLVACINLAGLLIARLSARRRELAVRRALGASSARVARQLVVETVLLTALAALVGVLVASLGTRALLGGALPLDQRTFGLALGLGLSTGLLIALWPSLRFARHAVVDELRQGTRLATGGVQIAAGRRVLVVAQVALSIVLLSAAGVLARSFANIYDVPAGFREDGLLTLRAQNALTDEQAEADPGRIDRLVEAIAAVPGVESAGAALGLPFSNGGSVEEFEVSGRAPIEGGQRPSAFMQAATPDYFEALGIPVLRGRPFTAADAADAPPVAVVNQAFAQRMLSDREPIGSGLLIDGARWEVVGVVGDVFNGDVEALSEPEVYRPMQQWPASTIWIAARTREAPSVLASPVAAAIQRFDPDIVVSSSSTMEDLRAESMGSERRMLRMMGAFALAAILISAIGLYGLMSYSVAQRVREFGVRLALGAGRPVVLRMVLVQGVRMAALGTALGLIGSLAVLPVLRTLLFRVSSVDPLTLGAVAALSCSVGLLAAYLPARRAMGVDPVTSLGEE